MSEQNKHKRPKYTIEFKQDAAKLVNEKGYTHKQAADNLGISLSAIGRWVRAEKGPTNTSVIKKKVLHLPDQEELSRLPKENEQLRRERELLKKAAGIEAQELPYNTVLFESNRRHFLLPCCVKSC
ncbi:MAG: transposase [Methylobacter sp.]|nr:transposase [Methylobacter sp.]